MTSRPDLRASRGDEGFTLVELLVAIVIIGVITVPLANVVIGYFRNADATTARLLESHDVQIASAYWAQDVASIGIRSATGELVQSVWPGASNLYACSTAAGTVIASLAWDEFTGSGVKSIIQVAYVVETVSGQLHRVRCQQSSGVVSVVSDVTIAHDLDPLAPPALVCSTSCAASPAVPESLTLTLKIKDPKNLGVAYGVTLTGQRRQS